MKFKRIVSVFSSVLCVALLINTTAFAIKTQPNSDVESISIFPMYGILEGQTRQMSATVDANGSFFNSVEWSSSNPNAISCTEDGKIQGLIAGESATITCKAKWGSVKDKIKVYCAEKIPSPVKCTPKNIYTTIYAQPATGMWSGTIFSLPKFFDIIARVFYWMLIPMNFAEAVAFNSKLTVYGRIKNYAYVRYGDPEVFDGFVKYTSLSQSIDGFLELSAEDIDIWADDITYTSKKLTTSYSGNFEWIVGNEDYVYFNKTTGQLIGKNAGVGKNVTITAKADGMTKICTIHLLYKWPQEWKTKTNKDTNLYKAEGNGYTKTTFLPKGREFVVRGDCGTNSGWAYGYYSIGETNYWGYIPIADASTKGTISQYNNLKTTLQNGEKVSWIWPVRDVKNGATQTTRARYISSPYGWRDTDPARHKGVDITNGVSSNSDFANSVDGYEVISAFAGKVVFVHDNSTGYKSCGNCVAIRSNEKDPVTGKYYVAIYMHLKSVPIVGMYADISANQKIGYVGNTGNSGGSHLHFEVNNQNLSYGQTINYEDNPDKEMVFGSVINPLFFYMNYYDLPDNSPYKIIVNPDCAAMKYRKPLWYGDDIKESKKP